METNSSPTPVVTSVNLDTQAPAVETPATPPVDVKETPKEEPMSARFAALARKAKQIEADKAALKAERSQVDTERAEYLKWKEDQGKPKAKKTPIEALMAEGYSYEDAANFVMNDNRETPEMKLKQFETKLEKMEREAAEREEAKLTTAKQESEAQAAKAIDYFKGTIANFMTENAETYELMAMNLEPQEAIDHVYELISDNFEATKAEGKPVILSPKEAAEMIEAYLEERIEKSLTTKKLQSKLKPTDAPTKESAVDAFTSKTLSNSVSSSSGTAKQPAKDDNDRIQRALALMG